MSKSDDFEIKDGPICLIVLGMAGSGKVRSWLIANFNEFHNIPVNSLTDHIC